MREAFSDAPCVADLRLPATIPFTTQQALLAGVTRNVLTRFVRQGLLRRVVKGVYVDATVADTLRLRAQALAMVVPETAVVTDRTAAWLHGVDILAPGDHLALPPISIFQPAGKTRVRTAVSLGGERGLSADDVTCVHGIPVTTPLRTALDLGRLTPRDHAIGALDGLLRQGTFTKDDLVAEVERFKGFRGVVQLRLLAPVADGRAESPAESVLRLRWLDAGLPCPDLQIVILDEHGHEKYRLDLGLEEIRYAAEYDGRDFHSSTAQQGRDRLRRQWLRDRRGWTVDVLDHDNVFGPRQRAGAIIRAGIRTAKGNRLRLSA